MKIIFLQRFWQEYQGIMYLSAIAKKHGHQVEVFISGEGNLEKKIYNSKPGIIGFSITTGDHLWAVSLAKKLRSKLEVPIILGGPHPTLCPEILNEDPIDIICLGEGELALVELLNKLEQKEDITKIKNLWIKQNKKIYKNPIRPLITNLDSIPIPDWSIYTKYNFLKSKTTKTFMGSRGCPFGCTCCINPIFQKIFRDKGKYVRQRGAENLIEEIKRVKETHHLKTITFDDEVFILNKLWLREFLKKYKEKISLPFFCGVRADLVDEQTINLLKEAGCYGVSFGIETGNEYLRNKILNKGISNNKIVEAASLIKQKGLILRSTNMFCLPDEDISKTFETVKLNIECKVDHPFAYMFQPLPKTKALEYAKKRGYLPKNFNFDYLTKSHWSNNPLILKGKPQMVNMQKFFYLAVKHPYLLPIIRLLVKLPPNPFYNLIFKLSLVLNYSKYKKLKFLTVFMLGLRMQLQNSVTTFRSFFCQDAFRK